MESFNELDEEIFEIKEDLEEILTQIGGIADIEKLEAAYNKIIDYETFGFDSLIQLLKSFGDTFMINHQTVILKNLDLTKSGALLYPESDSSDSTSYRDVPESIKEPSQLIGGSDNELENSTNMIYDSDGSCKKTAAYSSMEELTSIEGDDCVLDISDIDEFASNDEEAKSVFSLNEFISSLPIDDELFCSHLPAINRDPLETVPNQIMDKNFEDKLIYISEIFDPAHFWFQFATDGRYENFEDFHIRFNADYDKLKKRELMIADENLKEGLIVSAYVPQFKRWHRAKIINNFNHEKPYVRLFFIDYGTNGSCYKTNLRYLFQHFMKYPKYCFRGRVHGIIPVNNERSFKFEHIEAFINKVCQQSFYATVVKYESEEDAYQLKLIRRRRQIDIKEFLLQNKLSEAMNAFDNDGELSIGPLCYLIPSFYALERDYPTYAGLEKMKREDIDFNLVIDSNYFHNIKHDDVENNLELKSIIRNPQFSMTKKYFYGYF